MADLSLSTIVPRAPGPDRATGSWSREERDATLLVSNAVRQLNAVSYAGEGREITFSLSPETRHPVIKVIDSDTRQVLQQWPSDYLMQLVESPTPS
jgi:uncharacterized FlaG/YvyC family protein